MNLYRKSGRREDWNRFLNSLPEAERSFVEQDVGVSLAIRGEDYVHAGELAAQVAYGDRTESKRARQARIWEMRLGL